MTKIVTCEFCSTLIIHSAETRGRKPRFCSAACRSAAWRQRQQEVHAAELERAQSQLSMDLRAPTDVLTDTVREIEAATRAITSRGEVPDYLAEIVSAAQALTDTARHIALRNRPLSRQQRRKLERQRRCCRDSGM